jgi:hypothetical protein
MPARDLYLGDHWAVVRELPVLARCAKVSASLWVASAGYGLVPESGFLRSYSATFAVGQADTVFPASAATSKARSAYAQAWWAALGQLSLPSRARSSGSGRNPPGARSVLELARLDPHARILVVASPDYVAAMAVDLVAAAAELASPDHLIVVSGRDRFATSALARHIVPSDARLQAKVGGAMPSLHARVARKIVKEAPRWELSASSLRERYTRLLETCPAPKRYKRHKLTDGEVRAFILGVLRREGATATASASLRALRGSGRACEQHRFKDLFHSLKAARHAA